MPSFDSLLFYYCKTDSDNPTQNLNRNGSGAMHGWESTAVFPCKAGAKNRAGLPCKAGCKTRVVHPCKAGAKNRAGMPCKAEAKGRAVYLCKCMGPSAEQATVLAKGVSEVVNGVLDGSLASDPGLDSKAQHRQHAQPGVTYLHQIQSTAHSTSQALLNVTQMCASQHMLNDFERLVQQGLQPVSS